MEENVGQRNPFFDSFFRENRTVFSGQDYPIDELEQSDKEDVNFAFELCSSYNLAMKLYNKKIVTFDQTEYEKKPASFTLKKENCESWSFTYSLTRMYDGVSISYTDSKKNQTLKYKFMLKNGSRILKLNETAESLQDAEIKAKSKLLEHNRKCQTANLKVKGDTKYISSKCMKLEGFGKLDGKYYIDTVSHSKDAGNGYYCTLEAHLCIIVKGVTVATVLSGDTVKKRLLLQRPERDTRLFPAIHCGESARSFLDPVQSTCRYTTRIPEP